ncbi:uncharacterized protein LOC134718651 isoform X1 [Mytilus trossulus]|uniref:uncharacterized protein LOC134718651 isoform X1 n=1 Tax=Mytilus trossulus TaxID=6551 RepID=UPI003004FA38
MAYQTRKRQVKNNHDDIYSSGSETESSESTSLTLKKKKKKSSLFNAEQREYRKKIKSRKTEVDLMRERELNRIRQRRYREKKKLDGTLEKKRSTRTIDEHNHQRKKWREDKKKYLSKLPAEKKEAINEERRKSYAQKKIEQGAIPRTASLYGKPVVLPNSPVEYATTISELISNVSPIKREALEDVGILMPSPEKLQRIERNEEISRILEKQINHLCVSNAEQQQEYRKKIKSRKTEVDLMRERELNRIRQRRYREKKKKDGTLESLQKSRLSKMSKDQHKLRVRVIGSGNRCTRILRKRKNNLGNRKKSLGRTFNMRYKTWNKYANTDNEGKQRSDALTKEEIDDSHNTYLEEATPLSQTETVDNHGHQKPLPLPSPRLVQSEESVELSSSGELTDHHQVNSPRRSTDSRDSPRSSTDYRDLLSEPLPLPSPRLRQSEESVEPSSSGELTDHHQVNSPRRSTDSRDSPRSSTDSRDLLSEAMEEEFFLDDVEDEDIDEEDLVLGDEDDVTMVTKPQLNDEQNYVCSTDTKPTQRITKMALRVFFQFVCNHGIELDIKTASKKELAQVLQLFFLEVRKIDGQMYKRNAFSAIKFGLNRGFKKMREDFNFNDVEFFPAVKAFKQALNELKINGKTVDSIERLSTPDMGKLYSGNGLDIHRPITLQWKVFFDVLFFLLCAKGRDILRMLKPSHIRIKFNQNGRKYVQIVINDKESNSTGQQGQDTSEPAVKMDDRQGAGCMFEIPGHPKCPVTSLEKYLSKLPSNCNFLFAQHGDRTKYTNDKDYQLMTCWYHNAPVGKNTLGVMMREISKHAGLSKIYSNFSVHATGCAVLNYKGYDIKAFLDVSKGYGRQFSMFNDLDVREKISDILMETLIPNCTNIHGSGLTTIRLGNPFVPVVIPSQQAPQTIAFVSRTPQVIIRPLMSTAPPTIQNRPQTVCIQPRTSGLSQVMPQVMPLVQTFQQNIVPQGLIQMQVQNPPDRQVLTNPQPLQQIVIKQEPVDPDSQPTESSPSTSHMTSTSTTCIPACPPMEPRTVLTSDNFTGVVTPSYFCQTDDSSTNKSTVSKEDQSLIELRQEVTNLQNQLKQQDTLRHDSSVKLNNLKVHSGEYKRLLQNSKILQQHLTSSQEKNVELKNTIAKLKQDKECVIDTNISTSFENLCLNRPVFMHYTGFNPVEFQILFTFLIPDITHVPYRGAGHSLSTRSQLLLTLFKLRHNFTFIDLGHRFCVSKIKAKNIFCAWLYQISDRFQEVYTWPHRETLKAQVPRHFQQNFPSTFVLLKRIKIKVFQERNRANCSSLPRDQASQKSEKARHGILAVDPRGSVIGCSQLVAGNLSDSDLFENCGLKRQLVTLMNNGKLDNGDGILCEGLDIEKDLNDIGLKLNNVAFMKCDISDQLKTMLQKQHVQNHKILVDKAVNRLKKFRIISQTVSSTLSASCDKIFQVTAFLTNFQPPLTFDL